MIEERSDGSRRCLCTIELDDRQLQINWQLAGAVMSAPPWLRQPHFHCFAISGHSFGLAALTSLAVRLQGCSVARETAWLGSCALNRPSNWTRIASSGRGRSISTEAGHKLLAGLGPDGVSGRAKASTQNVRSRRYTPISIATLNGGSTPRPNSPSGTESFASLPTCQMRRATGLTQCVEPGALRRSS